MVLVLLVSMFVVKGFFKIEDRICLFFEFDG